MRFLALEANIRKLKRQFIAEGEEELLTTTRHIFAFLIPMLWIVPVSIGVVIAWGMGISAGWDALVLTVLTYLWLAFALGMAIHGFIEWRYNVLVITTEKIVIVDHRFVFSQVIRPIPLDSIATINTGSQYLGLGNCGYVNVHLSEVTQGTNKEVHLDRLPKPSVIAGVIENARVMKSQRSPSDKGPADQQGKVQDVQNKSEQSLPESAVIPPSDPAA